MSDLRSTLLLLLGELTHLGDSFIEQLGHLSSLPHIIGALWDVRMELPLPRFALSSLTLNDFIVGTIFLALPQVPLTLGNHAYALGRHGRRGRA